MKCGRRCTLRFQPRDGLNLLSSVFRYWENIILPVFRLQCKSIFSPWFSTLIWNPGQMLQLIRTIIPNMNASSVLSNCSIRNSPNATALNTDFGATYNGIDQDQSCGAGHGKWPGDCLMEPSSLLMRIQWKSNGCLWLWEHRGRGSWRYLIGTGRMGPGNLDFKNGARNGETATGSLYGYIKYGYRQISNYGQGVRIVFVGEEAFWLTIDG